MLKWQLSLYKDPPHPKKKVFILINSHTIKFSHYDPDDKVKNNYKTLNLFFFNWEDNGRDNGPQKFSTSKGEMRLKSQPEPSGQSGSAAAGSGTGVATLLALT